MKTIRIEFRYSVATVHRIIHENLNMRKCSVMEKKERHVSGSKEIVELSTSSSRIFELLVTCEESWIDCYDPETKR